MTWKRFPHYCNGNQPLTKGQQSGPLCSSSFVSLNKILNKPPSCLWFELSWHFEDVPVIILGRRCLIGFIWISCILLHELVGLNRRWHVNYVLRAADSSLYVSKPVSILSLTLRWWKRSKISSTCIVFLTMLMILLVRIKPTARSFYTSFNYGIKYLIQKQSYLTPAKGKCSLANGCFPYCIWYSFFPYSRVIKRIRNGNIRGTRWSRLRHAWHDGIVILWYKWSCRWHGIIIWPANTC